MALENHRPHLDVQTWVSGPHRATLPRISQLPKLHHTPSLSLSWQQAAAGLNEGQQGSAPALPFLALKPPILA